MTSCPWVSTGERYDLYSHDFRASTHETYARMREESPVHVQPGLDGETPIWFVASLPVEWDV